ncbi:MAG: hypothetical protein JSR82_05105, partial [Verrucomicrobia bacterium]|nr:hypothetical protein [Verrucomicrobiota bacterium]
MYPSLRSFRATALGLAFFLSFSSAQAALPRVFSDPNNAIAVRPGGTSYTWTYGTGTTPAAPGIRYPVATVAYYDVPAFSWFLTRGRIEYSTDNGANWVTYPLGNAVTITYLPVAGKIWRFVDTSPADSTSTNSVGVGWTLGGGAPSGNVGSGATVLPDLAPTDVTADRTVVFPTSALGSTVTVLSPVDTGTTTDGFWTIESQSAANAFTLSFDRTTGNTAKLLRGSGSLPALGQTVTVAVRYCDVYQTDNAGNPLAGQGFTKTLNLVVTSETSNALTLGNDFPVNTFTTNSQTSPSLAQLTTGNLIAVWQSAGQNKSTTQLNGVYGQLLSNVGAKVGSEFVVSNASTSIDEISPSVAALAGGRAVVAYSTGNSNYEINFRLIESNGTVGAPIQANTTTAGNQQVPVVAALTGGNFAIVWSSDSGEIRVRTFNSAGTGVTGEVQITAAGYYPGIAALSNGNYAVAWVDGSTGNVFTAVTGGAAVDTGITQSGYGPPRLAGLSGGGYVVASDSYIAASGLSKVEAARYNNSAVLQGARFTVNTTAGGSAYLPSVAPLSGGGFVIGWSSDTADFDFNGVFARRFGSTGTAVDASDVQINQHRSGDQSFAAFSQLGTDLFAAVWVDTPTDIARTGVYVSDIVGRALQAAAPTPTPTATATPTPTPTPTNTPTSTPTPT